MCDVSEQHATSKGKNIARKEPGTQNAC